MAPKSGVAEVRFPSPPTTRHHHIARVLTPHLHALQKKPASTAGKAPASKAPAGKAPAKKAVKKAPAGGDDKKRKRKTRKET